MKHLILHVTNKDLCNYCIPGCNPNPDSILFIKETTPVALILRFGN